MFGQRYAAGWAFRHVPDTSDSSYATAPQPQHATRLYPSPIQTGCPVRVGGSTATFTRKPPCSQQIPPRFARKMDWHPGHQPEMQLKRYAVRLSMGMPSPFPHFAPSLTTSEIPQASGVSLEFALPTLAPAGQKRLFPPTPCAVACSSSGTPPTSTLNEPHHSIWRAIAGVVPGVVRT